MASWHGKLVWPTHHVGVLLIRGQVEHQIGIRDQILVVAYCEPVGACIHERLALGIDCALSAARDQCAMISEQRAVCCEQ